MGRLYLIIFERSNPNDLRGSLLTRMETMIMYFRGTKMNVLVYTLLPVVFMIHEFEEIIFLKYWINKDKDYLHNKFPKIGPKISSQYSKFSTSGFTLAIAEEFVIISILTYFAIVMKNVYIWFAVFMGYSVHIIIHIGQWILYKKYIPVIVTSVLTLPYCIYGFMKIIDGETFKIGPMIICSIIGCIGVVLNLKFIHFLGHKFSKWENTLISS